MTEQSYYQRNKEKIKAAAKAYREANKEELKRKRDEKFSDPAKRQEKIDQQRKWQKNNRRQKSDLEASSKYGISLEEVQRLRSIPNCEICGVEVEHYSPNWSHAGNIDHCHATGKVRGMLCSRCNKGLGSFLDNPATLQQAIHYLEERS